MNKTIATAKESFVKATEACVVSMQHAKSGAELEAFRNAAATGADCYKSLASKYPSDADNMCDERVDAALESLEETLAWRQVQT